MSTAHGAPELGSEGEGHIGDHENGDKYAEKTPDEKGDMSHTSKPRETGSNGEGGQESSTTGRLTDAEEQAAVEPPEFESTHNDSSDSKGKPSSEFGDGNSSDTSELSEGEKLAFEQRRAEIRRGKAREASPVLSEAPAGAVPGPQPTEELPKNEPADTTGETLLPMPGPSRDFEYPDVMYIPWERDPGRPLQKLPIRFRDLNGRTYLLPWQRVRTWNVCVYTKPRLELWLTQSQRAKELIQRIHVRQPRVLTMINDGEYHLLVKEAWANEEDATVDPGLTSYPQIPTPDEPPVPEPSTPNPFGPPNNPMTGGRKNIPRTRDAIVLPETWDAVIEPGMYVDMVAWHGGPHPVFGLVPPQFGHGRGWAIPPPPSHIAHLVNEEGLPLQSLNMGQATGTMALARGAFPPRPPGQGRAATAPAPRKAVKTRVRKR